jgi:hypothetical protein
MGECAPRQRWFGSGWVLAVLPRPRKPPVHGLKGGARSSVPNTYSPFALRLLLAREDLSCRQWADGRSWLIAIIDSSGEIQYISVTP